MDDDVEAVEVTESCSKNKGTPLMRLFKRLISNDNKQNTVLTNTQIVNILKKEFDIDTEHLHELEVDIYLNVMKKYLKKWPQWDVFDRIINDLKAKEEHDEISKTLVLKYMDLKDYIQKKLDMVRPLAQASVKDIIELQGESQNEFLNVIMEVHCSRAKLNNLFYRRPNENKILNTSESTPSTINIGTLEYKDMFFWWSVGIEIKAGRSTIIWFTSHELKHVLVNKKLRFVREAPPLDQEVFVIEKAVSRQRLFSIATVESILDQALKQSYGTTYTPFYTIELLIKFIKKDMKHLPIIDGWGKYRRYKTKYPLVRYLYEEGPEPENSEAGKKYDIQLEETVCPRTELHFVFSDAPTLFDTSTISVKCYQCNLSYTGHNMLDLLRQHILSEHFNEPDWQCTNCKETISMVKLGRNKHVCNADKATLTKLIKLVNAIVNANRGNAPEAVFEAARVAARKFGYKHCWVSATGKIFVRKDDGEPVQELIDI